MKKINHLIGENYQQHPCFASDVPQMKLSDPLVRDFNTSHSQLKYLSLHLSNNQLIRLANQAASALGAIFAELKSQTLDEQEGQFLQELEAQASRCLSEQVNFAREQQLILIPHNSDDRTLRYAEKLFSQRFFFDNLANRVIEEIQDVASASVQGLRQMAEQGKLKREDLSINGGPAVRNIVKILNKAFRENGILSAVSSYSGVNMVVSGLALELSVPQSGWWESSLPGLVRPPQTLYAHLDESVQHPKSIVYLTDVAEKNGATSCYPGTYEALELNSLQDIVGRVVGTVGSDEHSPLHNFYSKQYHQSMTSEAFRRHYMRLPVAMRFNSHFGWDVFPGSAIETYMVQAERVMTGPAGTFMVFDGAHLVHRGGLIHTGERVVLQVIFEAGGMRRRLNRKIRSIFS